ncbi:MAG: YceD family protein [Hasllibacter sp.]
MRVRLSDLGDGGEAFDWRPDPEATKAMAERLGLLGLSKVRLNGSVRPDAGGWRLDARLGATVRQPCGITLAPVATRLEEEVLRRYGEAPPAPPGETEMSAEADEWEEAPDTLDLAAVAEEAISLALPAFPRAEGAELGEAVFAEEGVAPMTDEDARPFAGLRALRAGMED